MNFRISFDKFISLLQKKKIQKFIFLRLWLYTLKVFELKNCKIPYSLALDYSL